MSVEQVAAAKALRQDAKFSISRLARKFRVARNTMKKALAHKKIAKKVVPMSAKKRAILSRRRSLVALVGTVDARGVPLQNSSKKLAAALRKKKIHASPRTVRRDLVDAGARYLSRPRWPGLTKGQMEARVAFAKAELAAKKSFADVIFSDEKIFTTNDTERMMWCLRGQAPVPRRLTRWAPRCHVWGAIGVGFRFLVVLPAGSVTAASYIKTLEGFVRALPAGHKFWLQQDGAPAHSAKTTQKWLATKKLPLVTGWPPNSPDLSPIENLWGMLVDEVSRKAPSTKEELARAVKAAFDEMPQENIDDLVRSFSGRLRKCVDCSGGKVQ